MSVKARIQNNNTELQELIDIANNLPAAGGDSVDVDEELSTQAALIANIQAALENKVAVTDIFASIGVEYPAGSICTCTNGTKTFAAKNTSGQWVFAIPEPGTWTVTSTKLSDTSKTKSATFEILSEGQFESVSLSYGLYIFQEGVGLNEDFEVVWGTESGTGHSISKDGIVWSTNNGIGNSIGFNPKLDVSKYAKLCFEFICDTRNGNSTNYGIIFGVGVNQITGPNSVHDWVAQSDKLWNTSRATYEVPLTNVTGQYFVKMGGYATTGIVYNVWLEE